MKMLLGDGTGSRDAFTGMISSQLQVEQYLHIAATSCEHIHEE